MHIIARWNIAPIQPLRLLCFGFAEASNLTEQPRSFQHAFDKFLLVQGSVTTALLSNTDNTFVGNDIHMQTETHHLASQGSPPE